MGRPWLAHLWRDAGALAVDELCDERVGREEGGRGDGAGIVARLADVEQWVTRVAAVERAWQTPRTMQRRSRSQQDVLETVDGDDPPAGVLNRDTGAARQREAEHGRGAAQGRQLVRLPHEYRTAAGATPSSLERSIVTELELAERMSTWSHCPAARLYPAVGGPAHGGQYAAFVVPLTIGSTQKAAEPSAPPCPISTSTREPRMGILDGKNVSHASWKLLMGRPPQTGWSLAQAPGTSPLQLRQSVMLCRWPAQTLFTMLTQGTRSAGTGGLGATSLFSEELYVLRTTLSPASRVVLNETVSDFDPAFTAHPEMVGPVLAPVPP